MKLHKIYSVLCAIALVVGFSSCSKDDPIIEQLNNQQVYFPNTLSKTIELSPAVSSVEVPVMRMGTDAATVPLKVTFGENTVDLSVPTAVNFAAGAKESAIEISYDPTKIEPGHYDKLTLSFADDYNTPYGYSSIDLNIGQAEPWVSLGKGVIKDNWVWGGDEDFAEVEILQNQLYPNRFRVLEPFTEIALNEDSKPKDGFTHELDITVLNKGDVYNGVTISQDGLIVYNDFNTGYYHPDYDADIYVCHPAGFPSMAADDSAWLENKVNFYQEDGLPAQFSIAPLFYMFGAGGWNYTSYPDQIVITMPGVVIADYSCDVTYAGKFEDLEGGVFGEAFVELGEDVVMAKATIVPGRDNYVDGVMGIVEGTLENVVDLEETSDVRVAMPADAESGLYTFVVATFDADGNNQDFGYATFKYTASGEVPETYTLAGTGTFVYKYVFCNDDGSPYYDEGLEYYVCDQKPNRYKVSSIFYGVDFIFDVDDDGYITFDDQYTGYTSAQYGDLMVCDMYTAEPDYFPTPSYVRDNVFYFNAVYYANDGYWRYDNSENNDNLEYFAVDVINSAKAHGAKKAPSQKPKKAHNTAKGKKFPPSKRYMK